MKASTRFLTLWPSYLFAVACAFATTASALAGETITYFHTDVAGTPIMATDTNGMQAWKEIYQPYGDRLVKSTASRANALWFIGQPHDDSSGLSYLGARYYDPVLGRFMGIDPLSGNVGNVHSWNRYAYANNNPYRFSDPRGLQASPDDDRRRSEVSISGGSGWDGMDKKSRPGSYWGGWSDDGAHSTAGGMQNCVFTAGVMTCGVGDEPWTEEELRSGASLAVGFTPAGTLADICTAASGKDCITGEKVGGVWRFAGIVPFASELRKGGNIIDAVLDGTRKVHGRLPRAEDLARYDVEDLARLRDELQISVQTRIEKTVELGADYGHNARLAEEQQLLKSIEKHLKDR